MNKKAMQDIDKWHKEYNAEQKQMNRNGWLIFLGITFVIYVITSQL